MPRRRPHYAWIVFAVAFVTLLGAAGFRSTPGVLIDPLRDDLGWSRSTVGTAVSINVLLFGLMGPFAAALQATPCAVCRCSCSTTPSRPAISASPAS